MQRSSRRCGAMSQVRPGTSTLSSATTGGARGPWNSKDQYAGGGHGTYLRDGIGRAVLYHHFVRSADPLEPWFAHHGLKRVECRAALAFPTAAAGAAESVGRLRDLASRYSVDVIEFIRPGGAGP